MARIILVDSIGGRVSRSGQAYVVGNCSSLVPKNIPKASQGREVSESPHCPEPLDLRTENTTFLIVL